MKIGICFSGGIRNLHENIDSINKNIINSLRERCEVDIFIHGWYFKVNELENTHKMYKKEETNLEEVLNLLNPKSYKLKVYDKEKEN